MMLFQQSLKIQVLRKNEIQLQYTVLKKSCNMNVNIIETLKIWKRSKFTILVMISNQLRIMGLCDLLKSSLFLEFGMLKTLQK